MPDQKDDPIGTGTKPPEHGDAYDAVRCIYDHSPGRSWRRLNSALQDALTAAITAHLSFLPDDFARIRHDMNGGCWMGNSEGSTTGERYYSLAVKVGHAPACISFENFAKRPAALWCEDVKTPERLCIGSDFTWKGERLTVTNMKRADLIACAYGPRPEDPLAPGCLRYFDNKYRTVFGIVEQENRIIVSFGRDAAEDSRKPSKIVRIPYEELASVRKAADVARRQALKEIAATITAQEVETVKARLLEEHKVKPFRRFDLREMDEAIQARLRDVG